MLRPHDGKILGLAGAAALLLSIGALAQASPASATPPVNAHHYPLVPGVDGSSASIAEMHISRTTHLEIVAELAPAVTTQVGGSTTWTPESVTEARVAKNRRNYVQISGRYCTNKSGGDVFVADGVPVDPGLTCS